MPKTVIALGGSFNMPTVDHVRLAHDIPRHAALVRAGIHAEKVVVTPCGPRPDKPTTNDVDPWHRAAMNDLAFNGVPHTEVELSDLELATFTRTHEIDERLRADGSDVWHVVGADIVKDGGKHTSLVHRVWAHGPELWARLNFIVVTRDGYPLADDDLPPKSVVVPLGGTLSSTLGRERAFKRQSLDGIVPQKVIHYMDRHGLYRGGGASRITTLSFERPKVFVHTDKKNPKAFALREKFAACTVPIEDADLIVVIGGDGTFLEAVRLYWRHRLPFVGINAGHVGYMLNDVSEADDLPRLFSDLRAYHLSRLRVEADTENGTVVRYATNDAWLERAETQSAWLRVIVGGKVRFERMMGDGLLAATPTGSTAYARAMGGPPLFLDSPGYLLVGSNVYSPRGWNYAGLPSECDVRIRSEGGEKRPVRAMVDGENLGLASALRIRQSRTAWIEVAFSPRSDLVSKRIDGMFPPT